MGEDANLDTISTAVALANWTTNPEHSPLTWFAFLRFRLGRRRGDKARQEIVLLMCPSRQAKWIFTSCPQDLRLVGLGFGSL